MHGHVCGSPVWSPGPEVLSCNTIVTAATCGSCTIATKLRPWLRHARHHSNDRDLMAATVAVWQTHTFYCLAQCIDCTTTDVTFDIGISFQYNYFKFDSSLLENVSILELLNNWAARKSTVHKCCSNSWSCNWCSSVISCIAICIAHGTEHKTLIGRFASWRSAFWCYTEQHRGNSYRRMICRQHMTSRISNQLKLGKENYFAFCCIVICFLV